jgi:hypothetical protein
MVRALENLDITHTVSFPDAQFEENGTIDGPLTNFMYTLTKHDNKTGKDTIEKKEHYTFNISTMSFEVKPLDTQSGTGGNAASQSQGVVDIKDLKEGSSFAGGTIQKISFKGYENDATLDLTLAGEFTLEGTLQYSEFDDGVNFTVDKSKYPAEIKLSDKLGTINPFAWPMSFRPQNILVKQLGQVIYNKLQNEPGLTVQMVVRAKDLQFSCKIPGQAGGNWEMMEIIEIK